MAMSIIATQFTIKESKRPFVSFRNKKHMSMQLSSCDILYNGTPKLSDDSIKLHAMRTLVCCIKVTIRWVIQKYADKCHFYANYIIFVHN